MAAIRTTEPVFLGVVVNPKTNAPVFVLRRAHTNMTVDIVALRNSGFETSLGLPPGTPSYVHMGDGYLNDDPSYHGPTAVTGFPRSHTPHGVTDKGGGYGTCLYTGLVLLASAAYEEQLVVNDLPGDGNGISSEPGTRSTSATAWWTAAKRRGLTEQKRGIVETDETSTETEELDDEDVSDHVSRRAYQELQRAVIDAIHDSSEWFAKNISIRADLEREVEDDSGEKEITADYYTLKSARDHKLVALEEPRIGDMMSWAKATDHKGLSGSTHADVILALNIAGQDPLVVARLAFLAKRGGATDGEVTAMLMRHHYGVDVIGRRTLFEPGEQIEMQAPGITAIPSGRRRRQPPDLEPGTAATNPTSHPVRKKPPARINPSDRPTIEKELDQLAERRAKLGWHDLEDLP